MVDINTLRVPVPTRASLADCQGDAVILAALLEAIDLLDNEGHHNAMTGVISVALKAATRLADDLDGVKEAKA